MIEVSIINQTDQAIPESGTFQQWVESALLSEMETANITIVIVDNNESGRLNQTYRHKSGPTNILSFGYQKMPVQGDLVFCADTIAQEAKKQQKNLNAHYAHLTIHGTLHLLGYDHIEQHETKLMENKEIVIMQRLGFANPYQ